VEASGSTLRPLIKVDCADLESGIPSGREPIQVAGPEPAPASPDAPFGPRYQTEVLGML
jgi:hypothetical protein